MLKLLHRERLDLHYVANIQIEDPLVLVEEAEDAAHVRRLLFISVDILGITLFVSIKVK